MLETLLMTHSSSASKDQQNKIKTYIQSIVVVEPELELSGKVANSTSHETEENGCWGANVARSGSNSDEAGDSSRAEANDRILLL